MKTRVAVIYGGRTGEHEVSVRSAQAILSGLDPEKYEKIEYFIDKQGKWSPRPILPEPGAHHGIDVVFPVLHGTFGEDGTMQGLLELADLPLIWHFIGPIQSNKTKAIAEHFDWVHSVDRLKIAQRLSEQRPAALAPLNICLQVNVSGEDSKSGCAPGDLPALAAAVAKLPNLRLRGLMAIPEPTDDRAAQEAAFASLRTLQQRLGLGLDTLSMGMSHDLEAAIAQGATWVRIGTALFGARDYGPV